MPGKDSSLRAEFIAQARHSLLRYHLPRIERSVGMLSETEIWWRPNPSSNSVGNLLLHLEGNVRQWIVSGLGGAPDRRRRDLEFSEQGPLPRAKTLARLRKTVRAAARVLGRLSTADLLRKYEIQEFRVAGLEAVFHVAEHFAFHAGQIIYATKSLRGEDLGFTRLPGEKRTPKNRLPAC
jgi:uncharacterized damage-inducible protein DinB